MVIYSIPSAYFFVGTSERNYGTFGWCLSTLRVFAFPNTKTRFQYKPYEASLFEIILLISKL